MNKVYLVMFDTGYYEIVETVFSSEARALEEADRRNEEFNRGKVHKYSARKRYYVREHEVDKFE
jgi:hypothetical protein